MAKVKDMSNAFVGKNNVWGVNPFVAKKSIWSVIPIWWGILIFLLVIPIFLGVVFAIIDYNAYIDAVVSYAQSLGITGTVNEEVLELYSQFLDIGNER